MYTKIPMTFGMKLDTHVTRPLKIILEDAQPLSSVADQQRARPSVCCGRFCLYSCYYMFAYSHRLNLVSADCF